MLSDKGNVNVIDKELIGKESIGQELNLTFKNILRIENLNLYKNLKLVNLSNNVIERIEGLEELISLEELNLSFNNIKTIQGLEKLTKLKYLSLFSNQITKIASNELPKQLISLSLGNNSIETFDGLKGLSDLLLIKILILINNPITKDSNYNSNVCFICKSLKYLDYKLLSVSSLNYSPTTTASTTTTEQKMSSIHSTLFLSKLLLLDSQMLSPDTNFTLLLSQILFDPQLISTFHSNLTLLSHDITENVQKCAALLTNEIQEFNTFYFTSKHSTLSASLQLLTRHKHSTDFTFLYDSLLALELNLNEQVEDLLREFERNFTESLSLLVSSTNSLFTRLRELLGAFTETFNSACLVNYEKFVKNDQLSVEVRDWIVDKDVLQNVLVGYADLRNSVVDGMEEECVKGWTGFVERRLREMGEVEFERNRDRIVEIEDYCERLKSGDKMSRGGQVQEADGNSGGVSVE